MQPGLTGRQCFFSIFTQFGFAFQFLFDLIRGFQVEFLKIDGSVILNILQDPVTLAKVRAVSSVAKKIGVKTVAEFVESEEMITRLREIGIDYAQGFGISRPRPLVE